MTDTARDSAPATAEPFARPASAQRRRWLKLLAMVVAAGAVLWFAYDFFIAGSAVSTDNAYVGADSAEVTPRVSGTVNSVRVRETEPVVAGQILMTLDDTDAKLALANAQADLERAIRQVGQLHAQGMALQAQIRASSAGASEAAARVQKAQADVDKAQVELKRRERLASTGAVSGDELTIARNDLQTSLSQLHEAQGGLAQALASRQAAVGTHQSNQVLVAGPVAATPDVAAARTRVEAARLDLARTIIRAPIAGVIARRSVQVGQRVEAGATLMSVVPIQSAYVDANFKEVQLRKVAVGMPARLTSDLYGSGVVYHGRVLGFAGGTGSAFALVPAQNATGNWIKIVQRLPVRIALDPQELSKHPLRVGLSMNATIDLTHR